VDYFTLQDPDAKAAISCVVWNSLLDNLVQVPIHGEQVMVLGAFGSIPTRTVPVDSVADVASWERLLLLCYRQLRNRLEAEGLFDLERKRSLPSHLLLLSSHRPCGCLGRYSKTLLDVILVCKLLFPRPCAG